MLRWFRFESLMPAEFDESSLRIRRKFKLASRSRSTAGGAFGYYDVVAGVNVALLLWRGDLHSVLGDIFVTLTPTLHATRVIVSAERSVRAKAEEPIAKVQVLRDGEVVFRLEYRPPPPAGWFPDPSSEVDQFDRDFLLLLVGVINSTERQRQLIRAWSRLG